MKLVLAFCVILLHHSLISCRTVPLAEVEVDSPRDDMDSPTEEIANLIIPLIERTLEKNSKQRARKLIRMLPYNETAESSRWSNFNKNRVVEIMPLRRKQRRGEKPLAYLLAAPHGDAQLKGRQRGIRHEVEGIDKEHDIDHSNIDSTETKLRDYIQRKDNVGTESHETKESTSDESSVSSEESESHDEASDDDSSGDDGGRAENDNDNSSKVSKDKSELDNAAVTEKNEAVSDHERDDSSDSGDSEDDITEDTRSESEEKNESEEFVVEKISEHRDSDENKRVHPDHIPEDSDDSEYWGTDDVSFEGILDKIEDSNSNGDSNGKLVSNRSNDCRHLRKEDSDVSEEDRRHEHKSYRLSFLFNR